MAQHGEDSGRARPVRTDTSPRDRVLLKQDMCDYVGAQEKGTRTIDMCFAHSKEDR